MLDAVGILTSEVDGGTVNLDANPTDEDGNQIWEIAITNCSDAMVEHVTQMVTDMNAPELESAVAGEFVRRLAQPSTSDVGLTVASASTQLPIEQYVTAMQSFAAREEAMAGMLRCFKPANLITPFDKKSPLLSPGNHHEAIWVISSTQTPILPCSAPMP